MEYEPYRVPGQYTYDDLRRCYRKAMKLYEIERHLKETNLMNRAFSLDDELIKNWIANPSTFPQELYGMGIYLWASRKVIQDDNRVAEIFIDDPGYKSGKWIKVGWAFMNADCFSLNPSLLKPLK